MFWTLDAIANIYAGVKLGGSWVLMFTAVWMSIAALRGIFAP